MGRPPRVITSMDFLRQPDVLADFLAGSERLERAHALAWDLLVVDEAHNLAPLGFGERSDRSRMLADVAQHAEHRLFSRPPRTMVSRPASPGCSRSSTLFGSARRHSSRKTSIAKWSL